MNQVLVFMVMMMVSSADADNADDNQDNTNDTANDGTNDDSNQSSTDESTGVTATSIGSVSKIASTCCVPSASSQIVSISVPGTASSCMIGFRSIRHACAE